MIKGLTLAYVTARRDPKIEWFFDSLAKQITPDVQLKIVVVMLHLDPVMTIEKFLQATAMLPEPLPRITIHEAKPNVWQGEHRLTKEDWFAMANARNTALCLCETDYIAYVDDLSHLMLNWLYAVEEAMMGGYIACGAYRKVKNLVVENGIVKSFDRYSDDCRLDLAQKEVSPCTGDWLYGCSCAFPVEDLLEVGGWPEFCDGLGSEDYCLGIAISNAGKHLKYDKRMMTLESEEDHHREPSLRRTDKGVSPNDKSHAALNIAKSSTYYHNYYPGGMRALREHVLAGNPFPVIQQPRHDWFDGQPISEMI